jgi:hypothetical protein
MWMPTLYKARGVPTKGPVCAICAERTRGKTYLLDLGYGVRVYLCEGHSQAEFLERRNGRDLTLTLMRLWQAHGCMTKNRRRALDAYDERLRARRTPPARSRPGSYAWPQLRHRAERAYAAGHHTTVVAEELRRLHANGPAKPPSVRTFVRWHAQRRWSTPPLRL